MSQKLLLPLVGAASILICYRVMKQKRSTCRKTSENRDQDDALASFVEQAYNDIEYQTLHKPSFCKVDEVLGCTGSDMFNAVKALSPSLPVQFHFSKCTVDSDPMHPISRRVLDLLLEVPELAPTVKGPVKLKMRLSPNGKFIHRNRYRRNSIVLVISGSPHWLLLDHTHPKAAELLGAYQNDNWNGYRSQKYPDMLSYEQMQDIASQAKEAGVDHRLYSLEPGSLFVFNSEWWHATCYTAPVLGLFCCFGGSAKTAFHEHTRRMKKPMQKGLDVGSLKMAKVAMLSSKWTNNKQGTKIDWNAIK